MGKGLGTRLIIEKWVKGWGRGYHFTSSMLCFIIIVESEKYTDLLYCCKISNYDDSIIIDIGEFVAVLFMKLFGVECFCENGSRMYVRLYATQLCRPWKTTVIDVSN